MTRNGPCQATASLSVLSASGSRTLSSGCKAILLVFLLAYTQLFTVICQDMSAGIFPKIKQHNVAVDNNTLNNTTSGQLQDIVKNNLSTHDHVTEKM